MKKLILAACVFISQLAVAGPIPDVFRPGDPAVFGTSQLDDLQMLSYRAFFDTPGNVNNPNRVNAWRGVFGGAYIGNYPSTAPNVPTNERWSIQILEDGRFRIKPLKNQTLCVTHFGWEDYREFKSGGRAVKLSSCAPDNPAQLFFLQRQEDWFPIVRDWPTQAFVIRAISDPTQCLTVLPNDVKNATLSPLVIMDCLQYGHAQIRQRYAITQISNPFDQATLSTLKKMADVFALFRYHRTGADGSSTPIYLRSLDVNLVPGTLTSQDMTGYKKLPFQSPFSANSLTSYTNGTDWAQSLEVRRWVVDTFTKALMVSGNVTIPIINFEIKVDGKFEWTKSDQAIAGVIVPVPPRRTVWFATYQQKVSGRYNARIVSDLGYEYEIKDLLVSSSTPEGITSCDNASTSSACVNSWLSN